LAQKLRDAEISCELDHQARSLKSQFKLADRSGARLCAVLGPDELERGEVKLREMETSNEQAVSFDLLMETIRKILR
jgi:histidyl-tRNA synthetase